MPASSPASRPSLARPWTQQPTSSSSGWSTMPWMAARPTPPVAHWMTRYLMSLPLEPRRAASRGPRRTLRRDPRRRTRRPRSSPRTAAPRRDRGRRRDRWYVSSPGRRVARSPAISAASSCAFAKSASAGCTSCTSPRRCARAASKRRAVRVIHLAHDGPTSCARRRSSPQSIATPIFTSGQPNTVPSAASRMSPSIAISKPAPRQWPWIATTIGCGIASIPCVRRCEPR